MNAKRLIAGLVAAVTLTLFTAAVSVQQQATPQPAAEQNENPADAFFDRIEEEDAKERKEEAKESREERMEEARERREESMEEAKEGEGD